MYFAEVVTPGSVAVSSSATSVRLCGLSGASLVGTALTCSPGETHNGIAAWALLHLLEVFKWSFQCVTKLGEVSACRFGFGSRSVG
ncbi:hypothetical protein GDO78_023000 [Eleutherodactylus coqui]|uniref:Uncharacterized protein n=1 Tax=Eleutherodactylus coqui TaxID=57060 RepID=A0A8J6BFY7_ELECQ|nr:hypothetical protein GDO78_023000 [Eleutherodactylus coqui]